MGNFRSFFSYAMPVLFFCFVFFVSGCAKKEKKESVPRFPVRVSEVYEGELSDSFEVIGHAKPLKTVKLVARVSGFLQERNFKEGDYVKTGTLLYLIEPEPYRIDVRRSEAALAMAVARAWNASENYTRIDTLFKQKVTSPQKYDTARSEKLESDADQMLAKANLAQAELNLSYTRITAPFNGWIGLTQYDVGNYIQAPSGELATLSYIDEMRIEFSVSESHLSNTMRETLQNGQPPGYNVTLLQSDGSPYPEKGVITFWDNRIDPGTASLLVQALFPNSSHILMPGQFVKVRLSDPVPRKVLYLSPNAVRQEQGGYFAYVLDAENRIVLRALEVGKETAQAFVILSGLKEGEKAVEKGNPFLRPGMTVEVLK